MHSATHLIVNVGVFHRLVAGFSGSRGGFFREGSDTVNGTVLLPFSHLFLALLIGTVKELAYEDNSVSQYAVVEPFVDVKNVRDVFVITDFEGKGEIAITEQNKEDGENSEKEDADPTPSPSPSASPSPSPEGE